MNKVCQWVLGFISVSFLFGNAIAHAQTWSLIEGTGVTLQKPEDFEKAETFLGFQQEMTGASVVVTLIPGSYDEVSPGLTKEALALQGIQVLSKQSMKIADQPGLLFHLSQDAYGQTFQKWSAVFGDSEFTRIVTATFPESQTHDLSDLLRRVVLSSMLSDQPSNAVTLPFELGNVEGLTRIERLAEVAKVAAFSPTGMMPMSSPSEPFFIVAPSFGDVMILDPKSFAVNKLEQTPYIKNIRIQTVSDITIDGLAGVEIEAVGLDQDSEEDLILYQVVLFPSEGGYVVMHGTAGKTMSDSYLMRFRDLARTYRAIDQ